MRTKQLLSRRGFIAAAAGAAGVGAAALFGARLVHHRRPRPRFVVAMCVDCLRRDQVGYHGCKEPVTPRLDRLAASSLVIDRAYANSNWTKPSVASFFTGLWPAEHGAIVAGVTKAEATSKNMALPMRLDTLAETYESAGWHTAGFIHQPHLVPENGFAQGFQTYEIGNFSAEEIASRFLRWQSAIGRAERGFAYLHFLDCHAPYTPHGPYGSRFGPIDHAWDSCPDWRSPGVWAEFRNEVNLGRRKIPGEEAVEMLNLYQGAVCYVDSVIGKILDCLASRGVLDNALVCVFADHGEDFLEHGVLGHDEPYFFEEQIAIPMIVKVPASWNMPSQKLRYEAQTMDLAATLASAIGKSPFGHGRDLFEASRFAAPIPIITQSRGGMTVIRGGLKGYVWTAGAAPEIISVYDVVRDPEEAKDISVQSSGFISDMESYIPSWQEAAARMYAKLDPNRVSVGMQADSAEALRALGYLH